MNILNNKHTNTMKFRGTVIKGSFYMVTNIYFYYGEIRMSYKVNGKGNKSLSSTKDEQTKNPQSYVAS